MNTKEIEPPIKETASDVGDHVKKDNEEEEEVKNKKEEEIKNDGQMAVLVKEDSSEDEDDNVAVTMAEPLDNTTPQKRPKDSSSCQPPKRAKQKQTNSSRNCWSTETIHVNKVYAATLIKEMCPLLMECMFKVEEMEA